MKSCRVAALLLLAGIAPQALAQDAVRGSERSAACLPTASRAAPSCEPTTVVVRAETEVTFSIDVPPPKNVQCAAAVEIEYTQRDTKVAVEGTLEHKECAASAGEYKVAVSIRDASGELKTLEFAESWRREDARPVRVSGDYPIGENAELVRVRTRQLRCTCADLVE